MHLTRKIEIAEQSVRSISTHDDLDAAVRHAALQRLAQFIDAERKAIDERIAAKVAEHVGEAAED